MENLEQQSWQPQLLPRLLFGEPLYALVSLQHATKKGWRVEGLPGIIKTENKIYKNLNFSWVPFQALSLQSALGGFLELGITMSPNQELIHKKIMPYAISLGELYIGKNTNSINILSIAYTNSAVNPILYAFTLRPFRETIKHNFLCLRKDGIDDKLLKNYSPVPAVDSNNLSVDDKISPKIREHSQITQYTVLSSEF